MAYGDELITLVEIDQPFCEHDYGIPPCGAGLGSTGSHKCYNTAGSCQSVEDFSPGVLTLRFSLPQNGVERYGPVIPSLASINISPLEINLGGMDSSVSPFGRRESCKLSFVDHLHSDLLVDPYRTERPTGAAGSVFTPYERGTFWSKWLARNPYYEGMAVRVYEGVLGQAISDMRVRHYIIDKIDGPDDAGVTISCKDLFSLAEDRKSKAPLASGGRISNSGGVGNGSGATLTLAPYQIGEEYPGSGRVAMGDEIAEFSRSGDTLTLTARGVLGTAAESHAQDDRVQFVLSFEAQQPQDIVYDLLVDYVGIPASAIPKSDWDAEAADYLNTLYTAHLPEPVEVEKLIGELAVQAGFTIFPRVDANRIELKALVGSRFSGSDATITDEEYIREDSLSISRKPDQRVSQVWVYYGIRNWLKGTDEATNYAARRVISDLDAETDREYGQQSIREVWGRWLPRYAGGPAQTCGQRILSLFRDTPFRSSFSLDIQEDGLLSLASLFQLRCAELVDETGAEFSAGMVPFKLYRDANKVQIGAQLMRFFEPPEQNEFVITVDADAEDLNLRSLFDMLYGSPESAYTVIVNIASGVVIGSSNQSTPALNIGAWPSGLDIEITNNGTIAGRGGAGASGGDGTSFESGLQPYEPAEDGADGNEGGPALQTDRPITLENNGIVGGGGGGGGGGAGGGAVTDMLSAGTWQTTVGGGGGGGGRGDAAASGGSGGEPGYGALGEGGDSGGVGDVLSGGGGGAGGTGTYMPSGAGDGGRGGAFGQYGYDGGGSYNDDGLPTDGGNGGAPGPATIGESYITYTREGEVLGDRTG